VGALKVLTAAIFYELCVLGIMCLAFNFALLLHCCLGKLPSWCWLLLLLLLLLKPLIYTRLLLSMS
jgi:hypothetical protein